MPDQSGQTKTNQPAPLASPEDVLAMQLARDRTSPPELATVERADRKRAARLTAALRAAGWRIFR